MVSGEDTDTTGISVQQKDTRRTAAGSSEAWEVRTELVNQQARAENTANEAKTARPRAQRLEKEAVEAAPLIRDNPKPRSPTRTRASS